MAQKISDLFDFIERAVKSRKYPENTAQGLKAALKLFDAVLNEDERQSLDTFKKNIEQIYHSVSTKNGKTFSANSLAVYKSRVLKVLNDYEKYGIDPTKMANWAPKIINRGPRKQNATPQNEESPEMAETPVATVGMHKIELAFRGGTIKSVIIVPTDITSSECATIKAVLESLVIEPKK